METASSASEKSFKRSVLVVTTFASFIPPFLASSINLALPTIGREFSADAIKLGWVISAFILSSAIFLLPAGKLGDIIGRKKLFSFGMLFFTISIFLIVFSWNINVVIIFRLLQGISTSMLFGTSMAIVTAVFEPGERGSAIGINSTATYLGMSVGPVIGGLLTQHFGWRSIFIFLVPFGILSLILIKKKMKIDWADAAGEKYDWKGSLLYGFALLSLMYGFSRLPDLTGWICLISGLALILSFMIMELKIANPVFDFKLVFNNRIFAFSAIAALINYSATSAITFFLSLYLQYVKGFDARIAGLIMISQPVAMTVLSSIAGRLSDKKDPGIIASTGMGIISLCLVLLCFINETTYVVYLVILLLILGVGFGLFASPNSNAIMSSVDKKFLGVASATVGTMRTIGQMMSMAIAMMLLSLYVGRETIVPSNYPGLLLTMRTGFFIYAIFSALGIFASMARRKRDTADQ